jgi:hypothetical protein
MSALGQKPTCAPQKVMSALPPKADIALALPTHHHDTEALGYSFRNLSLQFDLALIAPPNSGDWLVNGRRL